MLLGPRAKKSLIFTGLDEEIVDLNVGFPFFIMLGSYLRYFTRSYGRSWNRVPV